MTNTRTPRRYDVVVTVFSLWMVGGTWLDGWGHHHGATESFFTPYHAALYSGFLCLAVTLIGYPMWKLRKGIRSAMPGYGVAVAGTWLFLVGGFGDMFWHEIFGVEGDVEAFISPPHMALFIGGTMMVLGPVAALRHHGIPTGWRDGWPAVLSVASAIGLIQFATEHANALLLPIPAGDTMVYAGPFGPAGYSFTPEVGVAYGLSAIMVQTLLISATIVVLMSRLNAPFGAITISLVLGVGHSLVIHDEFALLSVLAIAGLVGDALLTWAPRLPLWVVPTVVPATLYSAWLVALAATYGLNWNAHLVSGAVATATATGLVVGLLSVAHGQSAERYRRAWLSASRRGTTTPDVTAQSPDRELAEVG